VISYEFAACSVYLNEVLPTNFRGIGTATAMGFGRIGAVIAPVICVYLISVDFYP